MQTVVERELQLRLVITKERSVPVTARLSYTASDPYAVRMTFHLGCDAPVTWTFSRELLVEGVFRPCGYGDVRIWPTSAHGKSVLCLALTSPEGDALLEAPSVDIASWLEDTLRAVPPGEEARRLGLDDELEALFASDARDDVLREAHGKQDEGPGDQA